jgi:SAM-dependent methyltransferase
MLRARPAMSDYTPAYQATHRRGRVTSAAVIVPLLIERFSPSTVLDVGCGTGEWLAEFMRHGAEVTGLDGPWLDRGALAIPADRFTPVDLGQLPLPARLSVDLTLCLEVAEHLGPERADRLVGELTATAPIVVFSAAIPHQGGIGHVNERPQSHWVEQFGRRGYHPDDMIRRAVWDDRDVEWWYPQNVLVYRRDGASRSLPWDVVHPRCLEFALGQERRGSAALRSVARAVSRRVAGR